MNIAASFFGKYWKIIFNVPGGIRLLRDFKDSLRNLEFILRVMESLRFPKHSVSSISCLYVEVIVSEKCNSWKNTYYNITNESWESWFRVLTIETEKKEAKSGRKIKTKREHSNLVLCIE